MINYDIATKAPYMTVEPLNTIITERVDDIISTFNLTPNTPEEEFFTIRVVEMRSFQRFYVGLVGMRNLESVSFNYDWVRSS